MNPKENTLPRKVSRALLGILFVVAGANHFRDPALYLSMIPPWLPFPEALNAISGAAEIAGGIGVLIQRLRNAAALGLMLVLLAVFPANIHLALNGWPETGIPQWVLWARLPFQALFMAWVVFSCPGLAAWIRSLFPPRAARNFPKP